MCDKARMNIFLTVPLFSDGFSLLKNVVAIKEASFSADKEKKWKLFKLPLIDQIINGFAAHLSYP